ncbi:MAG: ATP-binding protein [Acidobacteria bacterium]|nr:ATP-binding protein [Acidobacteriota bacterium]
MSRNRRLTALFGLKWHPFSADVPSEAFFRTSETDLFLSRVESLLDTGGFALITGDSGTGKSVTLRLLAEHLSSLRDTAVGVLSRPQSGLGDFYRELGQLFGVPLTPHNRWAQYKALRERWAAHFDSTFLRPVLLVDEAQQASPVVLSELRLLSSEHFDSRSLLTVVLCGDSRLPDLFRQPDLVPLGTRIRLRLELGPRSPRELHEVLTHALTKAGNPSLVTPDLIKTIAEHSAGNYRVLCNTASLLLEEAVRQNAALIDDKIYFDLFPAPARTPRQRPAAPQTRS